MVVNGSKYAAREPLTKELKNNFSVIKVSGLKNNYPIGISEIGDTQFKIALEKSLLEDQFWKISSLSKENPCRVSSTNEVPMCF